MNQPYSRFFWRDYEQDLNLSACHPFAQAVWMRMLCIMQQGEPYGHLRMEPRKAAVAPTGSHGHVGSGPAGAGAGGGASGPPRGTPPALPHGLAGGVPGGGLESRYKLPKNGSLEHLIFSRCGVTEEQMEWSIAHLEEHGVFSRTPEGIIYCRRMVREHKAHADRVERARKAREIYERKRSKNPPDEPTRKSAPKRGNGVDSAVGSGPPSGPVGGGPRGIPRGGAGGVPGGPAITITSSNYKPTPLTPPAQSARGATETDSNHANRKPNRRERLLAEVGAAIDRRAGGA